MGEHLTRFKDSAMTVELLQASGVRVAYGVDATSMTETLPEDGKGPFDRIIFQFPQHPERRKIHKQRELLRVLFSNAEQLLTPHGEVIVSLCKGQGGTASESTARKATDTWQIQESAAAADFIMRSVQPCPVELLARLGYASTGFRVKGLAGVSINVYQDRSFNYEGSLTHVFCRDSIGATAVHPIEASHDISFWTSDSFSENEFKGILQQTVGPDVDLQLVLLDDYVSPDDGKSARTYRIATCTRTRAMTTAKWQNLCESVRHTMMQKAGHQNK